MFRQLRYLVGKRWCTLMHESLMWPVHGYYECGICSRRYPAFEEAPAASRPRCAELEPSASL